MIDGVALKGFVLRAARTLVADEVGVGSAQAGGAGASWALTMRR